MSEWIREVADNVRARGYVQGGLTREQYLFRQLCKMIDEVSEYAQCFDGNDIVAEMKMRIDGAARFADNVFKHPEIIGYVEVSMEVAPTELADVQVTIAMSADVLGFDVVAAAVEKSRGDIARGVR